MAWINRGSSISLVSTCGLKSCLGWSSLLFLFSLWSSQYVGRLKTVFRSFWRLSSAASYTTMVSSLLGGLFIDQLCSHCRLRYSEEEREREERRGKKAYIFQSWVKKGKSRRLTKWLGAPWDGLGCLAHRPFRCAGLLKSPLACQVKCTTMVGLR